MKSYSNTPLQAGPFGRSEVSVFPSQALPSTQAVPPAVKALPTRHTTASIKRQLSSWENGEGLAVLDVRDAERATGIDTKRPRTGGILWDDAESSASDSQAMKDMTEIIVIPDDD